MYLPQFAQQFTCQWTECLFSTIYASGDLQIRSVQHSRCAIPNGCYSKTDCVAGNTGITQRLQRMERWGDIQSVAEALNEGDFPYFRIPSKMIDIVCKN
jgi:hypothetical protein